MMPSVTPTKADLVFDGMGLNIHIEDFGRSYDLNWSGTNGVQNLLTSAGAGFANKPCRWVRDGIAAPSGDSAAHKTLFLQRGNFVGAIGPHFSFPMPMSANLSNLDNQFLIDWNGPGQVPAYNQWSALEGPNEPPSSQASQVRAFQQALYNAVKNDTTLQNPGAGIPAVQVLGPALTSPTTSWSAFGDMTGMCDVGNIHPYWSGCPESYLQAYFNAARNGPYATGSIDATETGWTWSMQQASPPPVPTDIITRYLPRLWIHGIAEVGFRRIYYYQMMANRAPNPTDPEAGYGLINNDGTLTSMWTRFASMGGTTGVQNFPGLADTQTFSVTNVTYTITGQGLGFHNVLLQTHNGGDKYFLCLWIGVNSWDPKTQTYTNVASQTVTVNLSGRNNALVFPFLFNDDGTITAASQILTDGSGNFTVTVTDKMALYQFS